MKTETEKFYDWMQNINNAFLSDNEKMTNAFRIVALQSENDRLNNELRKVKEVALNVQLTEPNFDNQLSEIEVNYEIVNTK